MGRSVVIINGGIEEHSTRAASDFVRAVTEHLDLSLERYGPRAAQGGEYRRQQRSIPPDALLETWPQADLARVLGPGAARGDDVASLREARNA